MIVGLVNALNFGQGLVRQLERLEAFGNQVIPLDRVQDDKRRAQQRRQDDPHARLGFLAVSRPNRSVPFGTTDQVLNAIAVPIDHQRGGAEADIQRLAIGGEHQSGVGKTGVSFRTAVRIPDDAAALAADQNVGKAVAVPVGKVDAAQQ